jgi:hypothetical protein
MMLQDRGAAVVSVPRAVDLMGVADSSIKALVHQICHKEAEMRRSRGPRTCVISKNILKMKILDEEKPRTWICAGKGACRLSG